MNYRPHKYRRWVRVLSSVLIFSMLIMVEGFEALGQEGDAEWQLAHPDVGPGMRVRHAMAYDSARDVTVLFGSLPESEVADTWEWNGSAWELVSTGGPEARSWHAMAYDSRRGVTVLFGGHHDLGDPLGGTWEWNGSTWKLVSDSGPEPLMGHQMVYDSARGVIVMFGGYYAKSGTWEWDGATWALVSETGPAGRFDHGMAYDSVRERTVLFGGKDYPDHHGDTWEWDGTSWELMADSGPSPRYHHAMAFDSKRGVTVMHGGVDEIDTWEWDGTSWNLVDENGFGFGDVYMHDMAYDEARGVTVLFGGERTREVVWDWDGETWTPTEEVTPTLREGTAMAYDEQHNRTIMFGGLGNRGLRRGDTWAWDGVTWTRVSTTGPRSRYDHAMVYNSRRDVMVLFGGYDGAWRNDTWEWDGEDWTQVADGGPSVRRRHTMAYDSVRGVVVLHGGAGTGWSYLKDTWEWDGEQWTQVATGGPRARREHAMVFDEVHGRTILFGGTYPNNEGDDLFLDDTWAWNGSYWMRVGLDGPPARAGHSMTYDDERGKLILFGGTGDYRHREHFDDTWSLSQSGWELIDESGPGERSGHSMAYDSARRSIVLFGGFMGESGFAPDTWEFQTPGIHLDAFTSCPQKGPARIQWSGATPDGKVAILYALDTGSFTIPGGYPCAGTQLDLPPKKIKATWLGNAGAYGRDAIDLTIPGLACGGVLQLIDAGTCATSNVAVIE